MSLMVGHGKRSLCRIGRAHRGLRGDHSTAGGTGQNPDGAEAAAEDGGGRLFLFRDAKAAGQPYDVCFTSRARGGK